MALSCTIRVNKTSTGAFPQNKRTDLTLEKKMWTMKYPVKIPYKKKMKALTGKMKTMNLQINVFLRCGPGVTCKFKRLIFSLGIKPFWKIFSLEF
uniref:Uncharacterized protein n=1 Tax=Macaca fascicularis TaxID=9541 RepID=Q9GMJ0_MACFA|nr:hypothetical protein [Macaca fascicularis]